MTTWFLARKPWIQFPIIWAPVFVATVIFTVSEQVPVLQASTIGGPLIIAALLTWRVQRAGHAHALRASDNQPTDADRTEAGRGDA